GGALEGLGGRGLGLARAARISGDRVRCVRRSGLLLGGRRSGLLLRGGGLGCAAARGLPGGLLCRSGSLRGGGGAGARRRALGTLDGLDEIALPQAAIALDLQTGCDLLQLRQAECGQASRTRLCVVRGGFSHEGFLLPRTAVREGCARCAGCTAMDRTCGACGTGADPWGRRRPIDAPNERDSPVRGAWA